MGSETERELSEAMGLLGDWLKVNERTKAWLARQVEQSPTAVGFWLDGSGARPVQLVREIIEALTEGSVPASSWELPKEREFRARALAKINGPVDEPTEGAAE